MTKATDVLSLARKYLGTVGNGRGNHAAILKTYNSHSPLARGYKVQANDNWCDTFVSFIFIKLGATSLTGTECGVERHVAIFKKKGIWHEDGKMTPKPGDIIVYNWDDHSQPNDGYADHIGFVEKVSGHTITALEGNKSNAVARRVLSVGAGQIRGYARPTYSAATKTVSKPKTSSAAKKSSKLVVDGLWGSATTRKLQALYGTTTDGILGPNTIKALQKRLGVTADGIMGRNTIKAMQRKLKTPVDGVISRPSAMVKAMQKKINEGSKPF